MKCKQLFTGFGTPYKRTSGMHNLKQMNEFNEESGDDETDMAKRSSAMKLLNDHEDDHDHECDSNQDSPLVPSRLQDSLRAHSPSPIRKRGSLLNLFTASNSGSMALTNGMLDEPIQKPKKLTVREVEDSFDGEIPDTP